MKQIFGGIEDNSYKIWMMAMATNRDDKWSEYHIDHYKKQIRQLSSLIRQATEKMKTL